MEYSLNPTKIAKLMLYRFQNHKAEFIMHSYNIEKKLTSLFEL